MEQYKLLQQVMAAGERLSGASAGGAHTELFEFNAESLQHNVAVLFPEHRPGQIALEICKDLAHNYLVKKGRISTFCMPLLGQRNSNIRRTLVSYAFGPVGYSLLPTLDKSLSDATEAVRLIPYLGFGELRHLTAPDFLALLQPASEPYTYPHDAVFLRTLLNGGGQTRSVLEILREDPHFHGNVTTAADLASFQHCVRRHPLTAPMTDVLAEFFAGPLPVGVQDTLRRLTGAHHPGMPWEHARSIILKCFETWGQENFLLPEITYYSYDTTLSVARLQALMDHNRMVAVAMSQRIEEALPARLLPAWHAAGPERVAFELLDFYHDYKVYPVEPYAGLLSFTTAKMLARCAWALFLQMTHGPDPETRNQDFSRMPEFHHHARRWLGSVMPEDHEQVVETLAHTFARYQSDADRVGQTTIPDRFTPIPRTFYTFQQRASVPRPGFHFKAMHSLHDLWKPDHADLWTTHPPLAEKMTVFFVLAYRYFMDTGFMPDLRPRNAGRDIFIYGLWGHITDNLLVVKETDPHGQPAMRASYVDNRDQFKQYRRAEDRRRPLGMAKYALRLIRPLAEPGLVRSIGIFVEYVSLARVGNATPALVPGLINLPQLGVDMTHKLIKDGVDMVFTSARSVVDDALDDLYEGARQWVQRWTRKVGHRK